MTEHTVDNSQVVSHSRQMIRESGMVPYGADGALVSGLAASDFTVTGATMEMDDNEIVHAVTLVLAMDGIFRPVALFVDFTPTEAREIASRLLGLADQMDGGAGKQ